MLRTFVQLIRVLFVQELSLSSTGNPFIFDMWAKNDLCRDDDDWYLFWQSLILLRIERIECVCGLDEFISDEFEDENAQTLDIN